MRLCLVAFSLLVARVQSQLSTPSSGFALEDLAVRGCLKYPEAEMPKGFEACLFNFDLVDPRGLYMSAKSGETLLVVDRTGRRSGKIIAMWDDDNDLRNNVTERVELFAGDLALSHGIAVCGDYLFASSDSQVYRWPYTAGQREPLDDDRRQVVITNVNADGSGGAPRGHHTRTLLCDDRDNTLYVSIGSRGNLDRSSYRARIRRFSAEDMMRETVEPEGGMDFADGYVFADGLRNTVGIAWDLDGKMWGVNNGMDNLFVEDLGGDIHEDNPGEELNDFPEEKAGSFYGYPQCWSEGNLDTGRGEGTQWVHPSFSDEYSDEWCRDPGNNVRPRLLMQAHTAPLGLEFFGERYPSTPCAALDGSIHYANPVYSDTGTIRNTTGDGDGDGTADGGLRYPLDQTAFPCSMYGDIFVALHGSWNRPVAVGFSIIHIPMRVDGMPRGDIKEFFRREGADTRGAEWPTDMRPVDVVFDKHGRLYMSSDKSGEILLIHHVADEPEPPVAYTMNTNGDQEQDGDGERPRRRRRLRYR
ncbi:unnamed protein product [Vitrella brassicaformis CCMP3155]|uniref:Pyrroloquinoline quinone-dependent pyranose dehydrogenase beta-propeller domain-containing protein n=1 Tax=Vitrella brassicaformis (strain CCMP3155) TaxID=1169540 RepID=A0A0G4ENF8_VITBC|nr:unnamed protein product [Vitrella brassicaformis CCMP3155]|eukprot:CEL99108.1 unnamed protein product [Vitrella brassicaformis CCMP3155]